MLKVKSGYWFKLLQSMVEGNNLMIGFISSVGPTMTEVPVSTIPLRVSPAGLKEVPLTTTSCKGINLRNK